MKNFIIITTLTALNFLNSNAQDVELIDLNKDGYKEKVSRSYDSGSSFSSSEYIIKNGKTKKQDTLTIDYSFASLYHSIELPSWFKNYKYDPAYIASKEGYKLITQKPAPLRWLLETRITEIYDNGFDQQLSFPLIAEKKLEELNENQPIAVIHENELILFSGESVTRKYSFMRGETEESENKIYYDSLSGNKFSVFDHGVFLTDKNDNKFWIFICDEHIDTNHSKLRHGAIRDFKISGDTVFILYNSNSMTDYIYKIDYKKGIIKRTSPEHLLF